MKRIAALILLACMTAKAQAAFAPFVVSDIRIDGLERISAGTVLTYLTVEKGDTLTQEQVQKAIRALFQTGFFKDIAFDRQGNILVIKVHERPAISKINLRGNKDIKSDDLLKGLNSMGMAEGQTFDRLSLDRMQQELIRQYYNRGKYNVSVDPHVVNLDRNRVSIDIEIHEGKAARIKRINIVGNKTYTDKQIRQGFESNTSNWTSWYSKDDQYSREKLSGDLEKLSNYYLDRGYADFNIDSTQVAISPDKQSMFITADVEEGDKYKVSDVKLLGNLVLPKSSIDKMVLVRKGQNFSHAAMEVTKRGIVALLSNIGYAFADVKIIPRLDRKDHTVDVSFYVKPGPRVYVRRINFTGNTSTRDNVARREMRQFEGGWYSQAAVDRSRSRLLRTGYFKSVNIDTKKVPGSKDQVDLQVSVEEQSAGSLQFGLGYSQLSGIIGTFSVSQNNFLGTGNQFAANIQRSSYLEQYGLSYLDPYLTDSGVSVGYNLQWSQVNQGNANLADFLYSNRSFDTTFGIPLSENNSISVGLGIASNTVNFHEGFTAPAAGRLHQGTWPSHHPFVDGQHGLGPRYPRSLLPANTRRITEPLHPRRSARLHGRVLQAVLQHQSLLAPAQGICTVRLRHHRLRRYLRRQQGHCAAVLAELLRRRRGRRARLPRQHARSAHSHAGRVPRSADRRCLQGTWQGGGVFPHPGLAEQHHSPNRRICRRRQCVSGFQQLFHQGFARLGRPDHAVARAGRSHFHQHCPAAALQECRPPVPGTHPVHLRQPVLTSARERSPVPVGAFTDRPGDGRSSCAEKDMNPIGR